MALGDDIADRLLGFAAETLRILGQLERDDTGKHVARQLTRCCTSGGANYEEARCAESRADFAHKVLVAAKEVRESVFWLRVVQSAQLSDSKRLTPTIEEGKELVAILRASARTARSRTGASTPEPSPGPDNPRDARQ